MFARHPRLRAALIAAVWTLLPASVMAQADRGVPVPPGGAYHKEVFGDWRVDCRPLSKPHVSCTLVASASEEGVIAGLSVDAPLGGDVVVALALAGSSMDEDAQAYLQVDGDKQYWVAPSSDTVALFKGAVADDLLAAFQRGRQVKMHFTLAPTGRRMVLLVSLVDFDQALGAYRAQLLVVEGVQG